MNVGGPLVIGVEVVGVAKPVENTIEAALDVELDLEEGDRRLASVITRPVN